MNSNLKIGKLILITLFLNVLFLQAQTNKDSAVHGVVTTSQGESLAFATVMVKDTKYATLTNEEGEFELELPYGTHTITVSYIGFSDTSHTVETSPSIQRTKVDYILKENAENLDEVTVNGKSKATAIETEGFAVNVIETKQASQRNIQTNELLNTTVGVKIRQNGGLGSQVEYSLNGLSGSAVRIFIDGIPISVYGSSFSLNSLPPSMIKRIEVYKGVVPGYLADDALGGAINVVLQESARNYLNASVSYGSFNTLQANANGLYRFSNSGFSVKGSLFHNYSDNDYEVSGRSVVVTGLGGKQTPITAKRFNDSYRSTGGTAQIGFTDVKWADQFLVGVTASDDYKEIQHGSFMTITPYKGRFMESEALLGNITYQKSDFLIKGLSLNVHGIYGKRNRVVNDTVPWAYSWNGERAIDFKGDEFKYSWGSQQEGGPTLAKIKRNVASVRSGLSYTINDHHKILLNHAYSGIDREDSDELRSVRENTFKGTRDLYKNILSATYELNAFQGKFRGSVFGKYYQQKTVNTDPFINSQTNEIEDEVTTAKVNDQGYGFAVSYAIHPKITLLTSAEKAIRLPNESEVFGNDGDNVVANPSIRPELSNNYNLGFRFGSFNIQKHEFTISTNFFARNIKDRIGLPIETSLNVNDETILYENQGDGTSKGIEAQLNYTYRKNLGINFNLTRFDLTIENRGVEIDVPNTPFFTMNAGANYTFENLLQKNSLLNFFYSVYYTDEFSYLVPQGKNTVGDEFFKVPEQVVHDFGLSYAFPNKNFVMSFDVKNLFDKPVYDNLSVQKPGRAFYLKLNYIINSI